jgi:hypothetical protein
MNKILYTISALLILSSCGGLDPRKLADSYCDCYTKHNDTENSWKCDTLAQQNARKLRNNEEAQRAYNVRLQDCMGNNAE